jgi:hypothetical protein
VNKWKITSLVLAIISFSQCDKIDVPDPVADSPVFTLSMQVNGSAQEYAAGENDYYMFSAFEKDANDIHTFIGALAEENCNQDCARSIRFEFRDFQSVVSGAVDIDNALQTGTIDFKDNEVTFELNHQLTLDAAPTPPPTPVGGYAYNWISPDTNSTEPTISLTVDEPDNYQVCLNTESTIFNCESTYCQQIFWDDRSSVRVNFEGTIMQQSPVLEANVSGGEAPYSYQWDNGLTTPIRFIGQDSAAQTYCLTITDAIGTKGSMCKTVFYQGSGAGGTFVDTCSALFTYATNIDSIPISDPFQFSTIAIEYQDEAGIVYRSDIEAQPSSATFSLTKIEPFERNENNEATLKLTFNFNCVVYEVGGSTQLELSGGNAVIAIAYPD